MTCHRCGELGAESYEREGYPAVELCEGCVVSCAVEWSIRRFEFEELAHG